MVSLKWKLAIVLAKTMRKLGEYLTERSYYIVPAVCQDCFDRRPAMNTCKACDFSSLKYDGE